MKNVMQKRCRVKSIKWTAALLFIMILALFLGSCKAPGKHEQSPAPSAPVRPGNPAEQQERQTAIGFYLDTVVRIEAYGKLKEELSAILERCAEYEAILSKTAEGSDVWRINHAGGKPVEVSGHTMKILNKAIEISSLSGGAFDVSIGPAVELWDFKAEHPKLPDAEALREAVKRVDYTKIELSGNRVTMPADMRIDFGGIAKGYIADEIADICRAEGIKSGLLNFGGNVVVIGNKPDGSAWRVGIQDPDEPTGAFITVVEATGDSSVVTSGTYERGFDHNGVRYHHLLDPATGWPAQNGIHSITIITSNSMEADALSTACFVLGVEKGLEFAGSLPGVEAVFVKDDRTIVATMGALDVSTPSSDRP